MTSERKSRLIIVTCQLSALLVTVAMLAAQYLAVLTPVPDLPTTGSNTKPQLGFVERWKLDKTTRERYNQLAQLDGLSQEQQQKLAAIAALLDK